MKQALLSFAAALALSVAAGPVAAADFTLVGDTEIIDFNGLVEGVEDLDLDADLVLALTGISGNDFTFSYALTNNSSGDDLGSRLTGFGFNVDPDFVDADIDGDFTAWASGNVPGSLPNVEFCATSGENNCSGGGGGGVVVGNTFDGTFTLTFGGAPGTITLSDLYVRYQSLGADTEGSGVGIGTPCIPGTDDCGGGGLNEIPEPSTWALMILGFGGAGAMLRRSRRSLARMAA